MNPLSISATTATPAIKFDNSTDELEIRGESYPENAFEFYRPILSWLKEYLANPNGPVTFRVSVKYMNTSSVKCMMDALDLLESAHKRGFDVSVYWYYQADNDRAVDMAEEFREEVTLPFHLVPEVPPA